jgi:signal transduction histidine kinase
MIFRIFAAIFLFVSTVFSSTIIINNDNSKINNFSMKMYQDKNSIENISSIQDKKNSFVSNNPFSIGYQKGFTWFSFTLKNKSDKESLVIYFTEAYYDIVDLYEVSDDKNILHKNGVSSHLNENNFFDKNPYFVINLKKNESKKIYIKTFAKFPRFGEFIIYTDKDLLLKDEIKFNSLYMFYFGGLFIIIIFNTFLFIKLKDAIYSYYVGYIFFHLLFIASLTSYTLDLGLGEWYYELHVSAPILMSFLLLFTHEILNVKKYSANLSKLFYFTVGLFGIIAVLILYDFVKWYQFLTIIASISFAILFFSSLLIWKKGEEDAKLYFIALSIYLSTMILFTSMANGWLENTNLNRYLFLYASFFEIIFFSLMLANRFNKANNEKLLMQEKLISLKSENEKTLEKKVNIRTKELVDTKEELILLNATLEHRVQKSIEQLRDRNKKLKEQTKLAQMGEMISMIAHQWRQPLGAINSAILSIQTKVSTNKFDLNQKEDQGKFLAFLNKKHNNINEYVQFLSATIDDFRNFFKPNKAKEFMPLTSPITKALQIVESSMENKNITITTNFEVNDNLSLHQNEMMQVILNIIKNSEDNFMEKNIMNPEITITTTKESSSYIILICDNGGGIDKEIMSKIFDPYFSTKDEKNGTGLGLYMSKVIVEDHNNGKLNVLNSDVGTCMQIILNNNTTIL